MEETNRKMDRWVGKQRKEKKDLYVPGKRDTDYPVGVACVPILSWPRENIGWTTQHSPTK